MKNHKSHKPSDNRIASFSAAGCMRWAGVLAAAASASYVPTVTAQEGLVLEEIVVTVRRRVEMEQDVPISLEVLDGEDLRTQNITEFNDLGRKIPSVSITSNNSTNSPIITVRGQRPTDTTLSLDQAVPIYFNEVVMTPSQGTNLAMYDLQSVQVLKGPQGTLFGRNSTGGAFMVTPTRPGVELGGYADVEVGNYNLIRLQGAVDLPATDAIQFRIAAQKTTRDGYQENIAPNSLKGEDFWDEDSQGMRISMNFDMGGLTNLATVSYDENDMRARVPTITGFLGDVALGGFIGPGTTALGPFTLPAAGFDDVSVGDINGNGIGDITDAVNVARNSDATDIQTDMIGFEKVENTFFSNITEFELTDSLSIKNVFGYRKVELESATDADGTALPILGRVPGDGPVTGYIDTNPGAAQTTESEQFSNELQLIGDSFDGDLEWIGGVYWYQMDATGTASQNVVGPNPAADAADQLQFAQASPTGDVFNEAYGIFVEGTYTFTDEWSATLGLRQSWDEREVSVRNTANVSLLQNPTLPSFLAPFYPLVPAGAPLLCITEDEAGNPAPNCERTESEDYSSPTGRFSLNYSPLDGMLVYGSVSTGYRAGGFNLRGTNNTTLQPFDEETVTTYEVGHKADWGLAGYAPIRTNFALYYQDYQDIQKTGSVSDSNGFGTTTTNAGAATIQGVEFDVTWAVTEALTLTMAYALTDASYDEWDYTVGNQAQGFRVVDASNNDFEWLPENTLSASAAYLLPLDPELGDLTVNVSVYWQDEMNTFAVPDIWSDISSALVGDNLAYAQDTLVIDDYAIWNLRLDWKNVMSSDFDAAFWVDNVADEEYVVGGFNQISSLGFSEVFYGPPMTLGASLRYNF